MPELAQKTDYKLILTRDKHTSDFPFLNINEDNVDVCLTGCYYRDMPRKKAIEHLASLCSKADTIHLYDAYLHDARQVLPKILPQRKVEVFYNVKQPNQPNTEPLTEDDITELKQELPKASFKPENRMLTHHDRYIIIDDKVEIILTSGFYYLLHEEKEISYIIREIDENRLCK